MSPRSDDPRGVIGALLCVGFRGSAPGDPLYEADLATLAAARVGAVVLFDVELSAVRRLRDAGVPDAQARARSPRNVVNPAQVAALVADLRRRLGAELLVCVDQEGGRVARLRDEHGFLTGPAAVEFAALDSGTQAAAAHAQARQLSALGIDLNLAPCVDVAVNPDGPVIARLGRSFGADPQLVRACARVVLDMHRHCGVAACLKHFPGHGSAGEDSHLGLPDVSEVYDADRELAVYRTLLRDDPPPPMVMAGHLLNRALDPDRPSSLSRRTLTGLLRETLGFRGVISTDSLDMRAIADRFPLDETLVLAINAGADLLVYGFNPAEGDAPNPALALAEAIERAVRDGRIEGGMERIRASAARRRVIRNWRSAHELGVRAL